MRNLLIALTLFAVTIALPTRLVAQESIAKPSGPVIRLEPAKMDLGSIQLSQLSDEHGKVRFEVFNDGTKPLLLKKVSRCCGTDIKSYTQGPILPGKSGEILVEFRIEPKLQAISRTVTVLSNAENGAEIKAPIVGNVIKDAGPGRRL